MERTTIFTNIRELPGSLADLTTPVGVFLRVRDRFPNSLLLESSDYHGNRNSMSFICFDELASFTADEYQVTITTPGRPNYSQPIEKNGQMAELLDQFIHSFQVTGDKDTSLYVNGLYGYTSFDAVRYFEDIRLTSPVDEASRIPEIRYGLYRFVLAFDHFHNRLSLIENHPEGEVSGLDDILSLLINRNTGNFKFFPSEEEQSILTDAEYMDMVTKGKEHCHRGDVFQIVLSRRFSQKFKGDEFNVYRALRRINPSPYLFYFDYGNYRIFGSSPESQVIVEKGKARINPIAGTFKRTGDDEKDRRLAVELAHDPKENAEHIMLVDLARNDLSRNSDHVKVENFREVQFYSHVLHMVSEVSGDLPEGANTIKVYGDSFPAGTLSGAPKYKAMEIIDALEPHRRGYYGGAIGFFGLNGDINHAITIRSFLSKNNTLYYHAGAGIVSGSKEENELAEVNNKLGALKTAIIEAKFFNYETE
ncbi:MAG: anthranilate synthase component I family protein [Bacteroidota bacterium]|nr:anthranilate synthase component I family protein [Bacteroidota bacterium]